MSIEKAATTPEEKPVVMTTVMSTSSTPDEHFADLATAKLTRWWSAEEENRVKRKLDIRILSVSFILYLLAIMDRSNIGNANTAGMSKDLGQTDSQYQWLLTIFYIAYIVFQFTILGYKVLPPRVWMTTCVFVWGLTSACQAAARNWGDMMVCRFFMGVAEAGYGTGIALYMSFFYNRAELGLRFGVYISGGAVSSAISGAVAYGLVNARTSLKSWRLLFLIEAIPTLLMAPIVFFVIPNSVSSASFLTDREKLIAEARLFRPPPPEASVNEKVTVKTRVMKFMSWKNASAALLDPISYLMAVQYFIINIGYSSIPVYLPTLISEMGYGSIKAQGLSAPPYVAAFMGAISCCWFTDRINRRGPVAAVLLALGGSGYMMLATLRSTAARYVAVWMAVIGLFSAVPTTVMWLMHNQAGESKKGLGLVVLGTIGQCGPLLGTRVFPAADRPYYVKGTAISGGLLLFGMLLATCTSCILWRINTRRDAVQGPIKLDHVQEGEEASATSAERKENDRRRLEVLMYGEDSPYFRYAI